MNQQALPTTLLQFFLFFVNKQRAMFILMAICHLAWSLDTLHSYVFKIFLDRLVEYQGNRMDVWEVIAMPIIMGAALWILIEVMFRIYDYVSALTYPGFEAAIRMSMTRYVQGHSHNYFAENFAGSIANKIGDMPQSATSTMQLIITLFTPSLVALIIGSSIFASMQPFFALIMVSWFSIHIGIAIWYSRECAIRSELHSQSRSDLTGKIVDSFTNISAVKAFARHAWEISHINIFQKDEKQKHKRVLTLIFKIRVIQGFLCFVLMGVGQTWLMIIYWQENILTAGDVTYIFYTSWGLVVMAWISGIELPNFFKEIGTCKQALALIKEKHHITDKDNAKALNISEGKIEFKDVTFGYNLGNNIFNKKNIIINPGEKVGLVGFSGSGKSTFVNLILRLYDTQSGNIIIDGQDIASITQDSLREQIAMIPQDTSLFHRTLMENIRYGRVDASDEEVLQVSKQANCHEFISMLPDGYNALVGERGVKLSGGQRQRIAIARAMLKNAPILILDEATSALDSVTEQHIQEALYNIMIGRTTIVIAHRLSTLVHMDRILVFDNGLIIENGTHEELLQLDGHYNRMWNMQSGGFLPNIEGE